jgi:hypothetical protein
MKVVESCVHCPASESFGIQYCGLQHCVVYREVINISKQHIARYSGMFLQNGGNQLQDYTVS